MGLNTNVVVFEDVPEGGHFALAQYILKALNFKILKEYQNITWADKAQMLYNNHSTIAITYEANRLILEDYTDKLSTYNKPCVLQAMSRERTISTTSISSTTDTSFYAIYKGEKYLSLSLGVEEFESYLAEIGEDLDWLPADSCLQTDQNLKADLEQFVNQFDYEVLYDKTFTVAEVVDLEAPV